MITRRGKTYRTIADAAQETQVSAKTIRYWVQRGIIDPPPEVEYGIQTMTHFPLEYVRKVKEQVREYREKRAAARNRNGKRSGKP